jgi:peptidyl-prolyl cis-trans isomerase D
VLRIIREGQRWLTGLFVVGVGVVFVFFLGLGNAGSPGSIGIVARVGPLELDGRDFERAREQREGFLQQQLGEQYDARRFADTLDSMAVRDLVDQALLTLAAKDLGITVSKAEIEQVVLEAGGFRDEGGRFDTEAFRSFAEYNFGSEANFMEAQRNRLLGLKVLRLLNQQPHVADAEVRAVLDQQLEELKIAYVTIAVEVDEESPVDAGRIEEALASRASELETLFEAQRGRFESPEQVRARHILVRVSQAAGEDEVAEAEARAQALLERVAGGETFDSVAREATDDSASRESGGDLGFFRRGQMMPEFEEAAFSAGTGELVGPVRSNRGFHVIRVEEHTKAVSQSLEDVREELARELLQQDLALENARAQADALSAAVQGGASLEEAARARELTLERSDWITRRPDGFIPGLGAAPEVLAAAFSSEAGTSSAEVFEVGDRLALFQVLERQPADPATVEERFEATREQLLSERRDTRAEAWVSAKRDALLDSGDLIVDLEGYRQRR